MEKNLLQLKKAALDDITKSSNLDSLNEAFLDIFATSGTFTKLAKGLKDLPKNEKPRVGKLLNEVKKEIEQAIVEQKTLLSQRKLEEKIDVTAPGIKPPQGHLHIITQTIQTFSLPIRLCPFVTMFSNNQNIYEHRMCIIKTTNIRITADSNCKIRRKFRIGILVS